MSAGPWLRLCGLGAATAVALVVASGELGLTRPAATGRFAVRPIERSMSRSSTWFKALAPPQARPSPTIVAARSRTSGTPPAPTNIPAAPVRSRRDMIRGFVSVT